jgi:hypothetical protein
MSEVYFNIIKDALIEQKMDVSQLQELPLSVDIGITLQENLKNKEYGNRWIHTDFEYTDLETFTAKMMNQIVTTVSDIITEKHVKVDKSKPILIKGKERGDPASAFAVDILYHIIKPTLYIYDVNSNIECDESIVDSFIVVSESEKRAKTYEPSELFELRDDNKWYCRESCKQLEQTCTTENHIHEYKCWEHIPVTVVDGSPYRPGAGIPISYVMEGEKICGLDAHYHNIDCYAYGPCTGEDHEPYDGWPMTNENVTATQLGIVTNLNLREGNLLA